ncbi:MAG: tyrosine-type recombinase/integrase [Pseudomonadota bacterium]|nr:tyrosine-type recombinase/integrase [Pseudomonadota bacterium]
MPSLFLTVEEMVTLTGHCADRLQIEALGTMGVFFLVNGLGRAVVTRAAVEAASSSGAGPLPPPPLPSRTTKAYPKGMRTRHRGSRVYYYLDTGATPRHEIKLGKDYDKAVEEWASLTGRPVPPVPILAFRAVAERYVRKVLPRKAPATQETNLRELRNLLKFFVGPHEVLASITPVMVRQYLDQRAEGVVTEKLRQSALRVAAGRERMAVTGKEGRVPANREKALLSHIWNFARETGLTSLANPCAGIKGFKEPGRDVYISDEVLAAVHNAAEVALRDALDLAYLTGQRPADTLKMSRADIVDGALLIKQNKTGKKVRVSIEGALAALIERIKSRKVLRLKLISMPNGSPMSKFELRGAFSRARLAAREAHPELVAEIKAFQFRDLRAKAGTDTEEASGMQAAQDQLGHSTPMMTARYVRHRRGKLVKPTK